MKKLAMPDNAQLALICGGVCYCYSANGAQIYESPRYVNGRVCANYCCDMYKRPNVHSWSTSTGFSGICDAAHKFAKEGPSPGRPSISVK